jgi:hypothetical protein
VRNRARAIHAITAAALLTLAATACATTDPDVTTKPKTTATKDAGSKKDTDDQTTETATNDAKVGDTITLNGSQDGSQLDVTVVKVADNAKSSVEGFVPEDGNRWLGVQFQLVNTGSKAYSDAPMNGTQIADADGQQFQPTFAEVTAGPAMAASVKLKPGAKALGWVTFELPKKSKAASVQFAMDSGFAEQTGEWKLG